MEEKQEEKRLRSASTNKKKKTAAVIVSVAAAAVVCGYAALCVLAGRGTAWPNTWVMGVEVSGLTFAQATDKVTRELERRWQGKEITFVTDNGTAVAALDPAGLISVMDLAQQMEDYQGQTGTLTRGAAYLKSLLGHRNEINPSLGYTPEGQQRLDEAVAAVRRKMGVAGNETSWVVGDTALTFTKGRTAAQVQSDALLDGVLGVLEGDGVETRVLVTVEQAPPAEPDFDALAAEIHTEPADAYLDVESGEVVEAVIGKELDVDTARLALSATAEGKNCVVPLNLTQPALTTEAFKALLFRDVLAEAVTKVTGTSDRVNNIKHAAALVNGTIVMPGEEFSFNQRCSPYSVENGYGKATAYVNGLSKDTVAGGICQASSTIYWASLKANLATVERNAHRYEPSYIKGGLDATVYGNYGEEGSLDFRFQNTTAHPIQIEEYVDANNYIHAVIRGTDETGIHGEPYSTNRVVTQAYKTIYKSDSSVPQGTTRRDKERTGYTGANIDTYQKLVDQDGNVISETKLYTSKYKVRDEVIYFNPADLELWGIDPATGIRNPAKAVAPASSTEPAQPVLDPVVAPEPTGGEENLPPTDTTPPVELPDVPEPVQPTDEVVPPPEEVPLPPQEVDSQPPVEVDLPVEPTPALTPETGITESLGE